MPGLDLSTQRQFRDVRSLGFCYLCGGVLGDLRREDIDNDHVPPSAIFRAEDRDTPLILPTHRRCNHEQRETDELLGQLVGALHGRAVSRRAQKIRVGIVQAPDEPEVGVVFIDLKSAIWRWVRGFHAALYRQHLPSDSRRHVHPPLTSAVLDDSALTAERVLPQQAAMVEIIQRNRSANRMDRIRCRNGKCVYECVWITFDRGLEACVFALDVYGWADLGETHRTPRRGCVGFYSPVAATPEGASRDIPDPDSRPTGVLDPFGG